MSSPTQPPYYLEPSGPPQDLQSLMRELREQKSSRSPLFESFLVNVIESLLANRVRSSLAILGIFIGIAAVIASLILSQGDGAYIAHQIASQGLNTVLVLPVASSSSIDAGKNSSLTLHDVQSLVQLPHVMSFSPFIITSEQVMYGNQHWTTTVEGTNTGVQITQNWQIGQGTWFSSADDEHGITVAVLGNTVAHNLSPVAESNLIGQQIRIRDQVFRVIGILSPKGGTANQDDVVFVPFKTAQIRLKNTNTVDQIQVLIDTTNNVDQASQAITAVLRRNHFIHTSDGSTDNFTVSTFTQAIQQMQQTIVILSISILTIATISLGVGGIGIMNIMLVSVTERTREIGILTALGARRRDIFHHFLMESLILCLIGGLIGLFLGVLTGWTLISLMGYPFIVTTTTLLAPFVVSTTIALIFGIYPAVRASRLEPVVAIRSE